MIYTSQPEEMVDLNHQASSCECSHLIDSLKGREMFDAACHSNTIASVRARIKEENGGEGGQNTRQVEK